MPFELLFGRKPRGILDLACNQWVGNHERGERIAGVNIKTLRSKLKRLGKWACKNLAEA